MSDEQYILSPSQGVRLMALAEILRRGDLCFRGHEEEDEQSAFEVVTDIAQEIALQVRA